MTTTEILLTIIGFINAIIAALLSVLIAHHLQKNERKKQDKMKILIDLMTSKIYGWTPQSINSMNVIDIIFSDSKNVKGAWHKFFDLCKINNPSEHQLKDIDASRCKLIEEIAVDLGYKGKLTWEEIQSFYLPQGMANYLQDQKRIQNYQLHIAEGAMNLFDNQKKEIKKVGARTFISMIEK